MEKYSRPSYQHYNNLQHTPMLQANNYAAAPLSNPLEARKQAQIHDLLRRHYSTPDKSIAKETRLQAQISTLL